ncbi:MAG: hypothetical protein FJ224_08535 [Lentisphaerae bacterium]|nr:hypothetical protein [Lentisphaerota bacterium]
MPTPAENVSQILGLKGPSAGCREPRRRWTVALVLALVAVGQIALAIGMCRVLDAHDQSSTLLRGTLTVLLLFCYGFTAVGAAVMVILVYGVLELVKWKTHCMGCVSHGALLRRAVLIPLLAFTVLYFGAALCVIIPCYIMHLLDL